MYLRPFFLADFKFWYIQIGGETTAHVTQIHEIVILDMFT